MQIVTLTYIAAVSFLAVILTVLDKNSARKGRRRIKERTLFTVSLLGGSAAMLIVMFLIRHKTRHATFMTGLPLIVLIQSAIFIFVFNSSLSVSHYYVKTRKINGRIRLALVADLHSCCYGGGQIELIDAIDAERPDAVLLCGDIFDDDLPPENTVDFLKAVSKYPCYYVSGNHEFWSGKADEYKKIVESFGIFVLEGTGEILEIHGDRILINGIDDPAADRLPSRSAPYADQVSRLSGSADDGLFTIQLSHRPELINELLPLGPDLVLSGHAHGGQWRLPVLLENGLMSPNQGLFPKYSNGEYFFDDTVLIVSRGLARESTAIIPRVFNRPEIVFITLERAL